MDPQVQHALAHGRLIDITTIGKATGQPRRIEIWFHNLDGHIYITGRPGRRDWYANLIANPTFTFHLKEDVKADLPAHARPITDTTEKRAVLTRIFQQPNWSGDLDAWMAHSPLIEVIFTTA